MPEVLVPTGDLSQESQHRPGERPLPSQCLCHGAVADAAGRPFDVVGCAVDCMWTLAETSADDARVSSQATCRRVADGSPRPLPGRDIFVCFCALLI